LRWFGHEKRTNGEDCLGNGFFHCIFFFDTSLCDIYGIGVIKMNCLMEELPVELQREREKILAKIDKIQDIMASGGDIKQYEKELDKYIERIHEIDAELWRDLNEYLGE